MFLISNGNIGVDKMVKYEIRRLILYLKIEELDKEFIEATKLHEILQKSRKG